MAPNDSARTRRASTHRSIGPIIRGRLPHLEQRNRFKALPSPLDQPFATNRLTTI